MAASSSSSSCSTSPSLSYSTSFSSFSSPLRIPFPPSLLSLLLLPSQLFFFFEVEPHYVFQASLPFTIFLPLPPKCWDPMCAPSSRLLAMDTGQPMFCILWRLCGNAWVLDRQPPPPRHQHLYKARAFSLSKNI